MVAEARDELAVVDEPLEAQVAAVEVGVVLALVQHDVRRDAELVHVLEHDLPLGELADVEAVSLLVVWKVTTMFALNYAPKPGTGSSPSITGCALNMCTRHSLMTVGALRTGRQMNSETL